MSEAFVPFGGRAGEHRVQAQFLPPLRPGGHVTGGPQLRAAVLGDQLEFPRQRREPGSGMVSVFTSTPPGLSRLVASA